MQAMAFVGHAPGLWLLGHPFPKDAVGENVIALGATLVAVIALMLLHHPWWALAAFASGHILWGWRLSVWIRRKWTSETAT